MLAEYAVLQQEFVSGHGVGVEMLYRHGKPVWYFCHERLHEGSGQPGLGGGSSYRQSIPANQELLRHAVAFLDALEWHGVAMVEYKVAKDGRFWLMEINPRLWGSLALAIDAGVDFPYALLCLATGREVAAQPAYKIGYRTRLLLPDLAWIRNRLFYRPDAYVGMEILKLLRPIAGRESWDYFDWGDLVVTAADFRFFVAGKLQSVRRKNAQSHQKGAAYKLHTANLRRFLAWGKRPRKILFLCYGNICRSPVAELLMRMRYPTFEVHAAGFHPTVGRASPPHIQSLAGAFSIDLSNSMSRRVTADMVRDADAVFIHDMRNYDHFCQEFPRDKNKILFLGLFVDPPLLEIKDPYDSDLVETFRILQQISVAIDSIGKKLSDSTPDSI
jgi:protein-tyrosine-phosphatase